MRPMRSPRMMRVEKSRTTTRSPYDLLTRSASNTSLPDGSRALGLQPHRAHLPAARRALGAHRHQRPHAPFVARAPRLDALPQPGLLLGQLLVELLLLQRLVREPLVLLAQERVVVARPRRQPAAIELDDPRRQPLEERAVVGDEQHRAGVSARNASSQAIASMSRWFVGSSSSSRSGCATSARASSTRRRHPPDSVSTIARRAARGARASARRAVRAASRRVLRARAGGCRAARAGRMSSAEPSE